MDPHKTVLVAPRGVHIDPRGLNLFIVQIVFMVLVSLAAAARAFVRVKHTKEVALDDWLMFLAVFLYFVHAAVTFWGIVQASAEGQTDMIKAESTALLSWFICEVIYAPLSALIRTSISLLLLRIAVVKLHRRIIHATVVVVWITAVLYFLLLLFQCSPVSYFYDQILPESQGKCIYFKIVPGATVAHSIIIAMADLTLAVLPVFIIWGVQMKMKMKVGVATLLSMGIFAGIALIIRIPAIKFIPVADERFIEQANGTALWSLMETSLGLLAGCVATLRPLVGMVARFLAGKKDDACGDDSVASRAKDRRSVRRSLPIELQSLTSAEDGGSRIGGGDMDSVSLRHPWQHHTGADSILGSPAPSAVHVRTSVSVSRDIPDQPRFVTQAGAFPLVNERVVTINGKDLDLEDTDLGGNKLL
ncbi:hypothetical protein OQA88_10354 [Cercophora sp. LCS_1]